MTLLTGGKEHKRQRLHEKKGGSGEEGRKGEKGRGWSSFPAMSCPDSLPVLIYMYPQGGLYKFSILTAENAKWLSSAMRRKVD